MALVAESRTLAVTAGEIAAIDDWVELVGARWGLPPRTVIGARLCVAELAANVLEHAAPGPSDRLTVILRRLDDGLAVEVIDTCAPFDPRRATAASEPASIAEALPGGRGLKLVRAFARSLSYRHSEGRNHVSLEIAAS
ncbi:MAG: ATP-binding protein [Hyphomicrobiales bacterium]|nr:ATP-binding protein [Hyphomicrobiales bacterium]